MKSHQLCLLFIVCGTTAVILADENSGHERRQEDNLGSTDAFTSRLATSVNYVEGSNIRNCTCNDSTVCSTYLCGLDATGYVAYFNVDFKDGARGIQMVVSNQKGDLWDDVGSVHLHINYVHNEPFATIIIGDTGGSENWVEVNQFIEYIPTGARDLYFSFSSNFGAPVGNILSFQFFQVDNSSSSQNSSNIASTNNVARNDEKRFGKRNQVTSIEPFTRTPATSWDYAAGGIQASFCSNTLVCDTYVSNIDSNGVLAYYDVNLESGLRAVEMIVAQDKDGPNNQSVGRINLHVDDMYSQPFASIVIGDTDGDENWVTVNQFIEFIPNSVRDLYFTFTNVRGEKIGSIASFTFLEVLD